MGRIPQEVLDRIQDNCDIVEIISGYVPLKKTGANFKTNCPFHKEKTPSFVVSPSKQIFHCFGCGQGGDVVSFIMKYEGLDFREAVESLAKRLGIPIPEDQPGPTGKQQESLSQSLFKISEYATRYYQEILLKKESANPARRYLKERGISEEVIKKFRLGFAPDAWDGFYNAAKAKAANLNLLEKSGLVISRDGKIYDRFRSRIIFPIFDIKSRPIAFGGRFFHADKAKEKDAALAKYINSPENYIYQKGKHLYGLNFAKDFIRQNDFCIIVEGYMDLVTPFQAGVKNIVASLGTALTEEQIKLLRRFTKKAVLIYDADKAGEAATLRGLDNLISANMEAKVGCLPQGEDPDSFIKKHGKDKFLKFVSSAKSVFDYKFTVLKNKFDISVPERKADLVSEMLSTIKKFNNEVVKQSYIKKLSEAVGVDEASLTSEMNKIKDLQQREEKPVFASALEGIPAVEKDILRLVLDENQLISKLFDKLSLDYFYDGRIKNILKVASDLWGQGKDFNSNKLITYFEDDLLKNVILELSSKEQIEEKDKEGLLDSYMQRVFHNHKENELKELQHRIKIAQQNHDEEELKHLIENYNDLVKVAKG